MTLNKLVDPTGPSLMKIALQVLAIIFILAPASPVYAQEEQPAGAVYIVQAGDTIWDIAVRFGVTMNELMNANGITDGSQIKEGDHLVIPGLEGVNGILTTKYVALGETLQSLSRRFGVAPSTIVKLNHLVNPQEIYAGMSLVIPQSETANPFGQRTTLSTGQSLLELAILKNSSPWTLSQANQLAGNWAVLPGNVLRTPGEADTGPGALPETISGLEVNSLPLYQGQTGVITLTTSAEASFNGYLGSYPLRFFNDGNGHYIALQGIHAMQEPGNYPLSIQGTFPDGTFFGFTQNINVQADNFLIDPPLTVDPSTIDPAITGPENELWSSLSAPATPIKMWKGIFSFPAPAAFIECYTSWYGDRRSYNNSPYIYFHTGLDLCTGAGTEVYAVADGTVVFAGPLTVRGNAVMIDHGWGVYTGYFHLSEIRVTAEEQVTAGQLIGISGGTGRVAGPHLHWEVLVGGIQVEPEEWLANKYP
jgi:murein DD-endopeptidase MepM/ murein hydrolase activator NlpD